MSRALAVAVALLLCPLTWADETGMELVGQARLQFLFWPIYDSRLYSADGEISVGQKPLRLEIEYLRDVASVDLVERTRKEWQRLKPVSTLEQQWLGTLSRLWPDVRANDVLAVALDDQGRSTFLLNGEPLGGIDDPAFGQRFLAIWLSPDTSQPELRLALIGKN